MDNYRMIDNLRQAGIAVESGMTEAELDRAETVFGFRFPGEIRKFLGCGVPVGAKFFDYRDVSEENRKRMDKFNQSMESSFRFDLKHNRGDMQAMLKEFDEGDSFDESVISFWKNSVRLIPFYGHRCFFDGLDGMPVISFWQPSDVIFYGGTFENYLEVEFLGKKRVLENIPERMEETGIWKKLIW